MTVATASSTAAAAEALASSLPIAGVTASAAARPRGLAAQAASAVVASFVGATSADLGLVLKDPLSIEGLDGAESLPLETILRPALEAAVETLGAGVLGEVRRDDASALMADAQAGFFELRTALGVVGWLAVRLTAHHDGGHELEASPADAMDRLARINDVEMVLTVEIGRTRMPVRSVLGLEPGAVVELDRSAGAPADILLNGRRIALGEIVVVDQDYAVRVTKILDVQEGLR